MATIALYANKINQMPGLLKSTRTAVNDLKQQMVKVKQKSQLVDRSVCNIDDVISTITASTQTQEKKIETLETVGKKVEEFVDLSMTVDINAAARVNKNKKDFYEKYAYLKPDCEKTGWEKVCQGLKNAADWCAEHWGSIVTLIVVVATVIAVVALCVITFGGAAVALAALVGAVVGLVGQLIADMIQFIRIGLDKGNWEWPSNGWDYVGAALGGSIGGILTLTGITPLAAGADGLITTLFQESLKDITGVKKSSITDIWKSGIVDGATAAIFSYAFDFISGKTGKILSKKIPVLRRLSGRGSYGASYKMVLTKLSKNTIKNFSVKSIRNGVIDGLFGDTLKNVLTGFGIMDIIKGGTEFWLMDAIPAISRQTSYVMPISFIAPPLAPIVPVIGIGLLPLRYLNGGKS